MRFPFFSRRKPAEQTKPAVRATGAVGKQPIDISIPRECIYRRFEGQPGPCPRCGGDLQQSSQTYLVGTRRGREITDSFVTGNDSGWFCTRCPVVVMDPTEVSRALGHGLPHWDVGDHFAVVGIVDLDAIPEEDSDLPLGDDDNPLPLVPFTNFSGAVRPGGSSQRPVGSARRKKARKKKRR